MIVIKRTLGMFRIWFYVGRAKVLICQVNREPNKNGAAFKKTLLETLETIWTSRGHQDGQEVTFAEMPKS